MSGTPIDSMSQLTQTELLRATPAASFSGQSRSSWDRLTAMGKNPEPIRLGSTPYWGRRELQAWIDHHCPDRDTWAILWPKLRTKTQPH